MAPSTPALAGDRDGPVHGRHRMRVFRADIDETLGRAGCDAGNRHAFDQHEGVAFHDHAVGESGAVAFVGIADDVFALGRRIQHRLPFDAGGEAGAATAAQAGLRHLLDDVGGRHRHGLAQADETAKLFIVFQRQRVGDAAARKSQSCLLGEERDLFRVAQRQPVLAAGQQAGIEQALHVGCLHRPIGLATASGFDLDHRFEEIGAARAVAHDPGVETALGQFLSDCLGNFFGAKRQRARVAGDVDSRAHRRTSATMSSIASSSSLPMTWPSSIADGAQAHSPRQ